MTIPMEVGPGAKKQPPSRLKHLKRREIFTSSTLRRLVWGGGDATAV